MHALLSAGGRPTGWFEPTTQELPVVTQWSAPAGVVIDPDRMPPESDEHAHGLDDDEEAW